MTALSALPGQTEEAVERFRLPLGHTIIEQADRLDGRVSQTVRRQDGTEYERIVSTEEACANAG